MRPIERVTARLVSPAGITFLAMLSLVLVVIGQAGWDPLELARLGSRFTDGDPTGSEGYDGQFVYYIARDPRPDEVAQYLDVPAYRYQRILLPLLARALSFGIHPAIPWVLAGLGVLSQTAGTWAVSRLLETWGISRWYALTYGLWVGLGLAVRLDLPEPLAFGLVAGAVLATARGKHGLSWVLYGLAIFAKEVTILFVAGHALELIRQRSWRNLLAMISVAVLPYLVFQLWLWRVFGHPGIGSGGAYATSFEWIPFNGLSQIWNASPLLFLATLVVFAPAVILPAFWGIWRGVSDWLSGRVELVSALLWANAVIIPFIPFTTYREPGGLLRFACGLVLAVLIYAGRFQERRVLNYSLLWLVMNAFLLK